MTNFYYLQTDLNNSLFINSELVMRIEKYPHCQTKNREKASYWRKYLNKGYGVLFEEPRKEASEMSKNMYGSEMMQDYEYYSLEIGENEKYTIIIGVSDYLGNTRSLKEIAFEKMQNILMKEGVGCLKKEVIEKLKLMVHYGPFAPLP